ncbi:MAG: hypothetical protein K8R54_17375 [Bacteroidales bacterium]|nr:hypothetical protein [Bacteroidales bacterium]
MKQIEAITKLPFSVKIKKGETKKFRISDSIEKFIISYNPNIQIKTKLESIIGDKYSDYIISGTPIDRENFNTIQFYKSVSDTIVTLSNQTLNFQKNN